MPAIVASQEKLRVVGQFDASANQPIEFVEWKSGEKVFVINSPFMADNNWWKNISTVVRNTTNKTITSLNVDLYFHRPGRMATGLGMRLYVQPRQNVSPSLNPSWIAPGETVKLAMRESDVQMWEDRLKLWGIEGIVRINLSFRGVYFDDGTGWSYGREFRFETSHSPDPTQKKISARRIRGNEPVEISKIRANGANVRFETIFKATGDWLSNLTLTLKNVSDRTISAVELSVMVLESKPIGPPTSWPIWARQHSIVAGGTSEVKFEYFDQMKKFASYREDITLRNTAELAVSVVYFADGTRWQYGAYYKPSPAKPGDFTLDEERNRRNPVKR